MADYTDLLRRPDAAEALAWLKEADDPEDRTISGGDGSETAWLVDEATDIAKELYVFGAVAVTAVKIEGYVEGAMHQDTSTLIVELPEDSARRKCLFAWGAGFARGMGWKPARDTGQKHLLIWRD